MASPGLVPGRRLRPSASQVAQGTARPSARGAAWKHPIDNLDGSRGRRARCPPNAVDLDETLQESTLDGEIQLISDGDGLAVIGEPSAVERFLLSEGLPSKDLGLPRLGS